MTAQSVSRPVFPSGRGPAHDMWGDVAHLVAWLDEKNGRDPHEVTMRIGKIFEEAGEAWSAHIGMSGQNPRKGITHTADDLAGELCDVIVTAAVALATVVGPEQARAYLDSKLSMLLVRAGRTPAEVAS